MISFNRTLNVSLRQIVLTGILSTFFALTAQTTVANPSYTVASLQGSFILGENGANQ